MNCKEERDDTERFKNETLVVHERNPWFKFYLGQMGKKVITSNRALFAYGFTLNEFLLTFTTFNNILIKQVNKRKHEKSQMTWLGRESTV